MPQKGQATLAFNPIILVDLIISMLFPTRRLLWPALFLAFSVATTASAAPEKEIELEVLGKLSLHAQTRTLKGTLWEISGQISDESGRPLAGVLRLTNEKQEIENTRACDAPLGADSPLVRVDTSGEFCLITPALEKGAQLSAEAEHFPPTSISIYEDRAGRLPSPRFTQAPQVLELDKESPVVVEVLASSGSYPHGAELSLKLVCESRSFPIAKTELAGSHLERFEFTAPNDALRGNCQFLAQSTAPNHAPQSDSRNVLVRSQARLALKSSSLNKALLTIEVAIQAAGGPVVAGLLEARSDGVFLVGSPIEHGRATIELECLANTSEVEIGFVPSGPSLIATQPITVDVPAKEANFRVTGLHILLLFSFCLWLGYAWLRPSSPRKRASAPALPKKGLVRATQSKRGPIEGVARDAHTGHPLAGVELTIFQTGADSKRILETQTTNAAGIASFKTTLESHTLLQLEATHVSYMNLLAPIHGTGLTIHLTERRRALLKNLVSWAGRKGKPWNQVTRPTPGDIERTAKRLNENFVADWAEQVARTAYGPQSPSEGEVEELKGPRNPTPP